MLAVNVWDSIWIGCLASASLYGCYRAVEWRWPERYIGMHETFGLSSTETWLQTHFADAVAQVATSLVYSAPGFHHTNTPERGIVVELRRYPVDFALRGVTRSDAVLLIEFAGNSPSNVHFVGVAPGSPDHWRAWEAQFSATADAVAVVDVPSGRGSKLTLEGGPIAKARPFRLAGVAAASPKRAGEEPMADDAPALPRHSRRERAFSTARASRGPRMRFSAVRSRRDREA